ncbi:hypothetical protein NQ318_003835 [Aromia moschata]|uniref:MADF domain-containing protein n=1 Tax=Aromia moschata TaxID=1265417 RepID=A0AAV8X7K0_9CUCU|nr:hypothetical protein NQ318_003835 [Aromia moschata]
MALTEKLIELVKKYPILYDLSHEEYKNVRKKDKVWEQIGAELNDTGKYLGDDVKKKWKNLRDTYMRHIRANKTKTGQAAPSGKKWQWSAQMETFRHFWSFANTSSNVTEIKEIQESSCETNYSENIISVEDSQAQSLENIDEIRRDTEELVTEKSAVTALKATPNSTTITKFY